MLPMAPVALAVIFFALASALEAGYRPSWWTWVFTLTFVGYLATYLSGRGTTFIFMFTLYALTAGAFTVILYRNSTAESFPDGFWPTPGPAAVFSR
jgi:hypothetical protein